MRRLAYLELMFIICITIILSTADAAADLVGARKLVFAFEQKEKNYKHFVYKRELFLWKSISSSQTVNCLQTNTRKKNNIFVQNVQDRTCCLANTVLVESLKSVHCCVSSVSNVCYLFFSFVQIADRPRSLRHLRRCRCQATMAVSICLQCIRWIQFTTSGYPIRSWSITIHR